MRLYSRIYKYHLQVRLFALTALVYAKSLKKIKNFKTSSILCEGNIDEESRKRQQLLLAAAEATTDREAATEQTKKSTRNHEDNERVLSNARNQTM